MKTLWGQYDSKSPRPNMSLLKRPKLFTTLQPHLGNVYVVMTDDTGHVIGVTTILTGMTSQKSFIQIEDFIVHPAHRRKGYGRDLMIAILDHFDHHDGTIFFAQAEVHPSRAEMIGLLNSMDFVQQAAATSTEVGAVHIYRINFFDLE
jgi:ribosomal protein S18 acetylase RimI-like enzyme